MFLLVYEFVILEVLDHALSLGSHANARLRERHRFPDKGCLAACTQTWQARGACYATLVHSCSLFTLSRTYLARLGGTCVSKHAVELHVEDPTSNAHVDKSA